MNLGLDALPRKRKYNDSYLQDDEWQQVRAALQIAAWPAVFERVNRALKGAGRPAFTSLKSMQSSFYRRASWRNR